MLEEKRRVQLALDAQTIQAINEELASLDDGKQPLERIHGRIVLEVVKGQFQLLEVSRSRLLIDKRRSA